VTPTVCPALVLVVVDVVVGEVLQFLSGGAMQEGGQSDEGFVRVRAGVGAPPLEQFALPVGGQRRPAKCHGLWGLESGGGVDEHQPPAQRVAGPD
jgi:hypothetical protein